MGYRNRTADILYNKMLETTSKEVSNTALTIMNAVQQEKTANQILGLAATLVCILEQYGLNHVDVLGIADNMVHSAENNNMTKDFKAITHFMKNEWEI